MKFVYEDAQGNRFEIIGLSEYAGYEYAQRNGLTVIEVVDIEPQPTPMTQAEIEEMLLDQEYRILLLEYGLEDEEVF